MANARARLLSMTEREREEDGVEVMGRQALRGRHKEEAEEYG